MGLACPLHGGESHAECTPLLLRSLPGLSPWPRPLGLTKAEPGQMARWSGRVQTQSAPPYPHRRAWRWRNSSSWHWGIGCCSGAVGASSCLGPAGCSGSTSERRARNCMCSNDNCVMHNYDIVWTESIDVHMQTLWWWNLSCHPFYCSQLIKPCTQLVCFHGLLYTS